MRMYYIAQGAQFSALWWPKWEGNTKKVGTYIHIYIHTHWVYIYIYTHTHARIVDSLCCIAENNTVL